jgi:hypothetical protein
MSMHHARTIQSGTIIMNFGWVSSRECSSALSVPQGASAPYVGRFTKGHAHTRRGLPFIHKPPSNREPLELVAHFNPAYTAHTMQPCRPRHTAERWQYKFDLHLTPQRKSFRGEQKHSALTNVHAVAGVVVFPVVNPAEQEWQRYLKPSRISSLDGSIHIRTQFPLRTCLPYRCHESATSGRSFSECGAAPAIDRSSPLLCLRTSSRSARADPSASRGAIQPWTREGCFPQASLAKVSLRPMENSERAGFGFGLFDPNGLCETVTLGRGSD